MVPHLDADVTPSHLVGHRGGGAGAEERIEHEVAGIGGDVDDALDEPFRFRRIKNIIFTKKR